MSLGERLRAYRHAKGLSLADLAQRSGVSKPYLSQLENGRADNPSVGALVRLADSLSVTIDALAGLDVPAPYGAAFALDDGFRLDRLSVDGMPLTAEEATIAREAIAEAVRLRRSRRGQLNHGEGEQGEK